MPCPNTRERVQEVYHSWIKVTVHYIVFSGACRAPLRGALLPGKVINQTGTEWNFTGLLLALSVADKRQSSSGAVVLYCVQLLSFSAPLISNHLWVSEAYGMIHRVRYFHRPVQQPRSPFQGIHMYYRFPSVIQFTVIDVFRAYIQNISLRTSSSRLYRPGFWKHAAAAPYGAVK